MKKTIWIMMLIILSTVVFGLTLTGDQLKKITDVQIKNYLQNNFGFDHYEIDWDDDYVRFYYDFKTMESYDDGYIVKNISLVGILPLSHWRYCRQTYSEVVCYNQLINFNHLYEIPNSGNYSSVYKQVVEQAITIYDKVRSERDRLISEEDLSYLSSVIPNNNLPFD